MRWKQKVGKAILINVIISQIMDTLPYDIHFMITFIHSLGYFKTIRNEKASKYIYKYCHSNTYEWVIHMYTVYATHHEVI